METYTKRLNDIITQISIISIESQKKLSFEKKMENYNKGNLLINEATQLIEKLQDEIMNINTSKIDKSNISRLDEYINILSTNNPKFDEIIYIVKELYCMSSGLPLTAQINDNVDQEVIYEHNEQQLEKID